MIEIAISSCSFYKPNSFAVINRFGDDSSSGIGMEAYYNDSLGLRLNFYGSRHFHLIGDDELVMSRVAKRQLRRSEKELAEKQQMQGLFGGYDWMGDDYYAEGMYPKVVTYSDLFCFFVPKQVLRESSEWQEAGFNSVNNKFYRRSAIIGGFVKIEYLMPIPKGIVYYYIFSRNKGQVTHELLEKHVIREMHNFDTIIAQSKY